MPQYVSCAHCHETCPLADEFCAACGHQVGVARMDCACPQCRLLPLRREDDLDLVDQIQRTLAAESPAGDSSIRK